ncbi:hypothetical protein A3759_03895 [Thalassolituus sp. HI0120]|nr:hypothetical protein A3759_18605 [Thalassolituus sp. HI0120]KZZ49459.1 hypothetical protein A3759_03895 [Thalassolituus sp. HI0120]
MRLLLTAALLFSASISAEVKTIYVAPEMQQQSSQAGADRPGNDVKKINKIKKPKAKLPKHSALNFIEPVLGIEDVKPWHKGTLAKDEMKPGGRMPTMNKFATKVFASKENTRGGTGIGGGGCGCN